jgi:hypothetical protein
VIEHVTAAARVEPFTHSASAIAAAAPFIEPEWAARAPPGLDSGGLATTAARAFLVKKQTVVVYELPVEPLVLFRGDIVSLCIFTIHNFKVPVDVYLLMNKGVLHLHSSAVRQEIHSGVGQGIHSGVGQGIQHSKWG